MSEQITKHETLNQYFIQLVHLVRLRGTASWKEVSPTCPFIYSDHLICFFFTEKICSNKKKSMGVFYHLFNFIFQILVLKFVLLLLFRKTRKDQFDESWQISD